MGDGLGGGIPRLRQLGCGPGADLPIANRVWYGLVGDWAAAPVVYV